MPILWRYLIVDFLKVVISCVAAFVAVLLTIRLDEIAHFAALGAPVRYLLLFIFYQIPYILPMALPLSCLIGALLLMQRLSLTHELTALRASGFSSFNILTPILLVAIPLSIGNFWIVSEFATRSHLQTNLLKTELRGINPLLLLHNKHLMRLKGFYFVALGDSRVGESASDVILALPNKHQQRLNLVVAKNFQATPSMFVGERVTLINGISNKQEKSFDHLLIENIGKLNTQVRGFTDLLSQKVWTVNDDYLQMPLLLVRIQKLYKDLQESQLQGERQQIKGVKMQLNRAISEIIRRFSIGLAVISFTLMGVSFGINISRRRSYTTLYMAIALTTLFLVSFFTAKGMERHLWLGVILYLVPHATMTISSIFFLRRIGQGIE